MKLYFLRNWIKEVEDDSKSRSSRNHQGKAPRNLQVLQKPSYQEAPLENISEGESTGRETKNRRVTGRNLIRREKYATIWNAEKLRQTEELAKLKARSQIFDKIENHRYFADIYVERNNPTLMEGRKQTSIIPKIPKIKKDGLLDRAQNIPEIKIVNINSIKEGCQK